MSEPSMYSEAWAAFFSDPFAEALALNLKGFPEEQATDPTGSAALEAARRADNLFNNLRIPGRFDWSPSFQIQLWERTLKVLRDADERRYETLHKGTPFYFMGIASYCAENFEQAMFYMDCALEQDRRLHGPRWYRIPSGMFVRLDDEPPSQAAHQLVNRARCLFEALGRDVAAAGGMLLSVDSYRARLVNYAVQQAPELRSVVTAFLSFLLEIRPRRSQLELAPRGAGSGEPFFLHLFKGALLFETLLRASSAGEAVVNQKKGATLNDLLISPTLYRQLGVGQQPQGYGPCTFGEVLQKVQVAEASDASFSERAIRAVWALRNARGHNLAWPGRPSREDYRRLLILVAGAIMIAIECLYLEHRLESGAT